MRVSGIPGHEPACPNRDMVGPFIRLLEGRRSHRPVVSVLQRKIFAMSRSGSLVNDWRQASLSSAWSNAEEWWTPAIDAVAEAIVGASGAARAACETLGNHRAASGVFLDEARADVMIAGRVAGLSSASTAVLVDGLTLGWVDRTLDTFFTSACVDPMTELATLPYLMTRLSELYASASARGVDIADEHAFVVVQVLAAADVMQSEMQMIIIQGALRGAFGAGETLARIGPNTAVAVVSRAEPALRDALGWLRIVLNQARSADQIRRHRMWLERLPRQRDHLPSLIRQLND
jgi:hypothetical protein